MNEKAFLIKCVEIDKKGQNKNLRFHVVDKDIMENLGFHHTYDFWILCESINNNISINIKISDDCIGTIDVLDDYFCQPYDFQLMIETKGDNAPQTAIKVQHRLYSILDSMKTFGVLEGWEWGDYV